ncbi:MAG: hypothetical protein NXH85_09560 [Pseudomonadaceae bacterium]|nr:hypothetical protein [Pseudomonadaceae bacterium]
MATLIQSFVLGLRSRSRTSLILATVFAGLGTPVFAADPIKVIADVPYSPQARIAYNVKSECTQLGTKLSKFLVQFGEKRGLEFDVVESLDTTVDGGVLMVEIDDAISRGAAGIGHAKFMQATAVLFKDGDRVASQTFTRDSMGGMFGAYKGSCAVLGRNSKAIGKDIANWLSSERGLLM